MKKLIARRGQLEIGELVPDQPVHLIGRSPACDMVLRASGVAAVQFILEWVGEGEFDPSQGFWALTSTSENAGVHEANATDSSGGQGVVVGSKGAEFGGFSWAWVEDRLSRPEIERGFIRKNIEADVQKESETKNAACLEVIRLSPDGQSVVDVEYLDPPSISSSSILREEPKLTVRWTGRLPNIQWSDLKARPLGRQPSSLEGQATVLQGQDLLLLKGSERSYLLRIVPRLAVPSSPKEMLRDPIYRWIIVIFAIGIAGVWFLAGSEGNPPPPVENQQRIAKVEIKEMSPPPPAPEPPPPPPPPPPPKEEPPPPSEKPSVAPPVVKSAPTKAAPKPSTASAPAFKSENKPPKAGLNSPAKVDNVNAVGLLGGMKKSGAVAGTVSADMIVADGIVTESVTGASGPVLVQQPPTGIVDMTKAARNGPGGQEGQDALMGASTTLTGGGTFDLKSNGPIGRKGGISGFSIGTGAGDEATSHVGPGGKGDSDFGESVVGGLDREAVRRAVAAHRREIRACYERALIGKPKLRGRVIYKWYISPEGPVTSISLEDSEVGHPQLEGCVMGVIRKIIFPKAPNGQATTVIYPFMFQNL